MAKHVSIRLYSARITFWDFAYLVTLLCRQLPAIGSYTSSVQAVVQAALFAIASAAEVLSSCIEGPEGAEGPADEATAASVAQSLLQLLLQLSAVSSGLGHSRERIQLLELLLMQTLAPALMQHLAFTGGQAQVS